MKLYSCHPSGAWNFEVVPRFLENLLTPDWDECRVWTVLRYAISKQVFPVLLCRESNAEMVSSLQVAAACFSFSDPSINSSKLITLPSSPPNYLSELCICQFRWPCGIRHRPATSRLLGLLARIAVDVCLLWVSCALQV